MALTLEDKWAIQEVINRFCHWSDYGEWDKLRGLFTADCVTELVGLDTRFCGPDQQVTHARHSDEHARGRNRHYNHNLVIDPVGDGQAWARYFIQQLVAEQEYGKTQLGATGRIEDRLLRTADGWKIAERRVHMDQVFRLSEDELANYRS
jgi:hypothetical protein